MRSRKTWNTYEPVHISPQCVLSPCSQQDHAPMHKERSASPTRVPTLRGSCREGRKYCWNFSTALEVSKAALHAVATGFATRTLEGADAAEVLRYRQQRSSVVVKPADILVERCASGETAMATRSLHYLPFDFFSA